MDSELAKTEYIFKKTQSELKNSITEIENTVEEISSILVDVERISNLENRLVEITQSEQQKEKMNKNQRGLRLPGTTTSILTFTLERSQRRREKGMENLFEEIMAKNLVKETGKFRKHTELKQDESKTPTLIPVRTKC